MADSSKIPLLAVDEVKEYTHSATMECGDEVVQDLSQALPHGSDDVVFEFKWELGIDRVIIREGSVTYEQSVATELSLAKTMQMVRLVPLAMLRGVSCQTAQPVFANAAAYKLIFVSMFCLSIAVLLLCIACLIDDELLKDSVLNTSSRLATVCALLFLSTAAAVGSYIGYTNSGPSGVVRVALPLETQAKRSYTGYWLPRCAVPVFHTFAFLACVFGGAFTTRAPPFGLAPWFSLFAFVALVAASRHGRVLEGTSKCAAFGFAALGLVTCVALGFAATYIEGTASCSSSEPVGWFCAHVQVDCIGALDMCNGHVEHMAFSYFILLLVSYVPVGIFVYSVEEVGYTARSSADAAIDKPMVVTLLGPETFGYPLSMHLRSDQVKYFIAEVAKRQFTERYTKAALATLPLRTTVDSMLLH
eukprot:TRINITY_DN310_c0_g1_i11.p1 TRINITY_DN310_c0_g1~~TRINITY_DN310_c0_g1_i11.p1  ORF type:complete len:418 (+),score=88.43 TRINITY_DN310_c0_g1_i11:56-1309(+)